MRHEDGLERQWQRQAQGCKHGRAHPDEATTHGKLRSVPSLRRSLKTSSVASQVFEIALLLNQRLEVEVSSAGGEIKEVT